MPENYFYQIREKVYGWEVGGKCLGLEKGKKIKGFPGFNE